MEFLTILAPVDHRPMLGDLSRLLDDFHFLQGKGKTGERYAGVYVNSFDEELEAMVTSRGYRKVEKYNRPITRFEIPAPAPNRPVLR